MSYFNTGKKENRKLIFDKYNGHCAYCGAVLEFKNLQIDHKEPLRRTSRGVERDYSFENCMPSCGQCNSSKSSFELEQWRKELDLKVHRLNDYHSIYRICKSFGLVFETGIEVKFYFERYGS